MSDPAFDFSLIGQMAAAMEAAPRGPRYEPLPDGTFPAPSLMRWMEAAELAGVPAVPAEAVGTVAIDAVLQFDVPNGEGVAEAMATLEAVNALVEEGTMLRWDCCAGYGVKASLGEGSAPAVADKQLFPDDPRAFDLLYDFPSEEIALVKRPWVQAQVIDGFPVEFRVFVEDGRPVAVANYYLQRDLPDTSAMRQAAGQAVIHTQAILDVLKQQGAVPAMPRQPNPQQVAATLDFLVTPDNAVLFLEAGPGHFFGAHPCAFLSPDGRSVATLEGYKRGSGLPTLALDELP